MLSDGCSLLLVVRCVCVLRGCLLLVCVYVVVWRCVRVVQCLRFGVRFAFVVCLLLVVVWYSVCDD